MPSIPPSPWRLRATLIGLLAALIWLPSCSLLSEDDPAEDSARRADTVTEIRELLGQRSRAIKADRAVAFRRTLAPGDRQLRRLQMRYFNNLQQLPLQVFGYRVLPETVQDEGSEIVAEVELRMQLRDFDRVPVRTRWRYHFTRDDDRLLLSQVIDRAFVKARDIELSPWEMTAIEVRHTSQALGIFDAESVDTAPLIMDAVQRGIDEVGDVVPYDWDRQVVVYALSDVRALAQLDNLPGGDADRLDGVAFPVRARDSGTALAAIRFMLHPRMLERAPEGRDRLIRHELTHVALRARDDNIPTWLAEGIAEWTSVQPIPSGQRLISRDALTRSEAGLQALPNDRTFNGRGSSGNYGIAWWACDYIVAEYGEDALWRLVDRMGKGQGTSFKSQDRVLREVLKIDGAQLAEAAGQRIVATFG